MRSGFSNGILSRRASQFPCTYCITQLTNVRTGLWAKLQLPSSLDFAGNELIGNQFVAHEIRRRGELCDDPIIGKNTPIVCDQRAFQPARKCPADPELRTSPFRSNSAVPSSEPRPDLFDRLIIKFDDRKTACSLLSVQVMYQHAKRDVHNFSEAPRQSRFIEPGVFSVPKPLTLSFHSIYNIILNRFRGSAG